MNTPSVHRFVSAKRPAHIDPKIGRRREPTGGAAYTSEGRRGYSEGTVGTSGYRPKQNLGAMCRRPLSDSMDGMDVLEVACHVCAAA
jgi:hypothetical protein